MAEIRSTMDIIMEKAKGLTMTEDEKREFREKEIAGKVKGLVQRFLDGLVNIDLIQVEIAALGEKDRITTRRMVREECAGRIFPGQDNGPVLEILEDIAGMDITAVRDALADFDRELDREREVLNKTSMERLHKRGISGSAVMPNLEADPEWTRMVLKKREDFGESLSSLLE